MKLPTTGAWFAGERQIIAITRVVKAADGWTACLVGWIVDEPLVVFSLLLVVDLGRFLMKRLLIKAAETGKLAYYFAYFLAYWAAFDFIKYCLLVGLCIIIVSFVAIIGRHVSTLKSCSCVVHYFEVTTGQTNFEEAFLVNLLGNSQTSVYKWLAHFISD